MEDLAHVAIQGNKRVVLNPSKAEIGDQAFHFASDPHRMRGLRGKFVVLRRSYELKDWNQIRDELRIRESIGDMKPLAVEGNVWEAVK